MVMGTGMGVAISYMVMRTASNFFQINQETLCRN